MTRALQGARHCVELQSFRGIAALCVLLFHASHYFDPSGAMGKVANVAFVAAPAAVLSFFVLSGFVLTLSQLDRPRTIREAGIFYLRRAFRIYPALWFATLLAVLYQFAARRVPLASPVSDWWLSLVHRDGLSARLLIETLAGRATELTLPVWTLYVELVGSLLMPLIIFAVAQSQILLSALFLTLVAMSIAVPPPIGDLAGLLVGFVYGGALVPLTPRLRSMIRSDGIAFTSVGIGIALLMFGGWLFNSTSAPLPVALSIHIASLGALLALGVIYVRPRAFAVLARPAFATLGDVSYSLYLVHMPIIGFLGLALALTAARSDSLLFAPVLIAATVILSAALSIFSYRYIEVVGIRSGRKMIDLLFRHRSPSAKVED